MRKALEDFNRLSDDLVKNITDNIDEAIKENEFYSMDFDHMKKILKLSKIDKIDSIRTLIHNAMKINQENGIRLLSYIKYKENENEDQREKGIRNILEELKRIPVFKEIKKLIDRKDNEMEELKVNGNITEIEGEDCEKRETEILVDWKKLYEREHLKTLELESIIMKLQIKCEMYDKKFTSKAPKERKYKKKEIKEMVELFEKRDEKKVKKLLSKDPSLIFMKDLNNNKTLLHVSIDNNWVEGIDIIHEAGIGVDGILDIEDIEHNTPLLYSFSKGKINIMKHLILIGANIDSKDSKGKTLLMMTAQQKQLDIINFLLAHGATAGVNESESHEILNFFLNSKCNEMIYHFIINGINQISINKAVLWAVEENNFDAVNFLISMGAVIETKDKNGKSLLMIACEKRNLKIAKLLIYNNANLEAKDDEGKTSLMKVCENGEFGIAKLLIAKGANMESLYCLLSALEIVSYHNHLNIVKLLVDNGAYIESRGFMPSPLITSLKRGNFEVAKYLISKGADIEAGDGYGNSAIMCLTKLYEEKRLPIHLKEIEFLIRNGAKYEEEDELMNSCGFNGKCEVVKDLLSNGANIEVRNKYRWTPLIYAAVAGNIDMVKLLVSYGACVNEKDCRKQTALAKACVSDRFDIVRFLYNKGAFVKRRVMCAACKYSRMEIIELLISNNILLPAYPLVKSAIKRRDVVEFLISRGANVNAVGKKSNVTALMKACEEIGSEDNIEIIELLVLNGAIIESKGKFGRTPLMYAIKSGNIEAVKFLVTKGANIEVIDRYGENAFIYAIRSGNIEIIKFLIDIKWSKCQQKL